MTEEQDLANAIKSKFADNDLLQEQSKQIDELKQEIEQIKNPPPRQLTEKQAAREFLDHTDSCKDEKCSIHAKMDDIQKKAFLTGALLAKKKFGRN
jgi:hypothetical protein